MWLTNKQWLGRWSAWEISVTLTFGVQTWRRAEDFHMSEWLKRGAWKKAEYLLTQQNAILQR